MVWVVMKKWPGGKIELYRAYTKESDARYAASLMLNAEEYVITLHTLELQTGVTP